MWKKYSKSKQTKYLWFVKLGVRWAERDNKYIRKYSDIIKLGVRWAERDIK